MIALLTPGARSVEMASILPRSASLGMVTYFAENTQFMSRENYLAHIDVGLAGWLAEELFFSSNDVSSGAMSDLQKVNQWTRDMVDAGFGAQTKFFQLTNGQPSSEQARFKYE